MKKITKTVKSNGLMFELNIDANSLIEQVKDRFRGAFTILKKMVRSREKYIRKMHREIKDPRNRMRMFSACVTIYEKVHKIYGIRLFEYDVLASMYQLDHVSLTRIVNYSKDVGIRAPTLAIMNRLCRLGYIAKSERKGFFYITTEGKNLVDNVLGAIKQDMTYYISKKPKSSHIHTLLLKDKFVHKYSQEELERRRKQYINLMKPYWDAGYKKMPKDRFIRYEILDKWVRNREMFGLEVTEDQYRWRQNAFIKTTQP
jgi:hypothetical protein